MRYDLITYIPLKVNMHLLGNGDNRRDRLVAMLEREAQNITSGRLEGIFARTKAFKEQVELLGRYYQTARHYSQSDLRNIGRDIGMAIYHFSNTTTQNGLEEERHGVTAYRAFAHLSDDVDDTSIPFLDEKYLREPILAPAVFSLPALDHFMRIDRMRWSSKRALSEISIRKELNIEPPREFSSDESSQDPDFFFKEAEDPVLKLLLDETEDEDLEGSDSDPSGDELPLKEILRLGGLMNILEPESEIIKLSKVKRKTKKSKRPSSASAAWGDNGRPTTIEKLVRSSSAKATRRPFDSANLTIKSTPSLPTGIGYKQSSREQKHMLRTYEKSNYIKATENALRRQAAEPFVILPPAALKDMSATDQYVRFPRRQSSDESLDMNRKPLSRKESKVMLRPRGLFFPESARHII